MIISVTIVESSSSLSRDYPGAVEEMNVTEEPEQAKPFFQKPKKIEMEMRSFGAGDEEDSKFFDLVRNRSPQPGANGPDVALEASEEAERKEEERKKSAAPPKATSKLNFIEEVNEDLL
jgi:hypothetical protein